MDGQRFERDLEKALRRQGLPCRRPRQDRPVDVGDLWLQDDIVIQAKAWKNLGAALTAGVAGATTQAVHARRPFGVAVIKKPNSAVDNAIVAMPLSTFIGLLKSRETPAPAG